MEGEREKSPVNAEQEEENIDSVSSDGQGTCGQPSSSTSAVSSKPESPGKQMDDSERALIDTNLSHTPVPEAESSEQISNSGLNVASNIIKEVKQGEEMDVAESVDQESQQLTVVSEKTPVSEKKESKKKVGDKRKVEEKHENSGEKIETDVSSDSSDIADADDERCENVKKAKRENNTHDESGNERRFTRSTAGGKDKTSNRQSGGVQGNRDGYFYGKAEVNQEQENKNRKKENGKDDKNSKNKADEKTLTVVFHAILSKKFKLDDGTTIVIRGDEPVFAGGWDERGVPIISEGYFDEQLLLRGEIKVPLRLACERCGYKYILLDKKNEATHEELVEFRMWGSGIMNRCLVIGKEYAVGSRTLHKYDGFIYPEPTTWDRIFSSPMDDRRAFFQQFFPKWSGFYVDSFDFDIQPVEALQKLECLFEGITAVWTSDTTRTPCRLVVNHRKLRLWEVFEKILMPKVTKNLEVLEGETKDAKAKVHAVLSSIIITYVFTNYNIYLRTEQYEILLKCLKLPPDKEVCFEFMKIINGFDDNILSTFNKTILQFYQQQSSKISLVNWLLALPLLHFLRRESKPFEDVSCEKPVDGTNWKSWGLKEFSYRDIRKNITGSKAIDMLPDLMNVFDMDRLLKRTFLLLCPVEIYGDLLENGCFSCLELCVTMRKLLPDTKGNRSYTQSFVKYLALFFKKINETLSLMSPEQFPKGQLQETLVLLNSLVYLVEIVKQHLQLNQVEVLCRLVECSITTIVLQKKGIDLRDEPTVVGNENDPDEKLSTSFQLTDIPREMSSLLKKQYGFVGRFIDVMLPVHLEHIRLTEWDQELQAWNELLSLSAPEIFYKQWHKNFMAKFQSRIHKVSSFRQIELFCQSDKQECNSDIATCLSDVAFKAVEKVVKDGYREQITFNCLNQNRSSTNGIKLLSTMLHKAWPQELKEDSQLNEKEKILLNHLLTWSTWPGFLKFFGSSSSSKEELTKQGDCGIIMASAESCLDNLINSVENGELMRNLVFYVIKLYKIIVKYLCSIYALKDLEDMTWCF